MDSHRNILDTGFSDLSSYFSKKEFIFSFLILNPATQRFDFLNQQYQTNHLNLEFLLQFLENEPDLIEDEITYYAVLDDIRLVLFTPILMIQSYKSLPSERWCKQFIYGLLNLNEEKRNECLKRLKSLDPENIFLLQKHLLSEWMHILIDNPSYQSLVNETYEWNEGTLCTYHLSAPEKKATLPAITISTKNETELDPNYEDIKELFEDPILFTEIKNPKITPQGTTYEEINILQTINRRATPYDTEPLRVDPFSKQHLNESLLLPNHLFLTIKTLFSKTNSLPLKEQLYEHLTCSLSHQLFSSPVVAENGHTYERHYIEAYLEKHMQLPDGTKQTKPFYPNRFIMNLLETPSIKALLDQVKNSLNILRGKDGVECVNQLLSYINMRVKEENYAGWGSLCKWDKLSASIATMDAIDKKINIHTFFANTNHLNALKQGRLKAYAEPALHYLSRRAVKA